MKLLNWKLQLFASILFLSKETVSAQSSKTEKGIFIPSKQAKEDDYNNSESRFNYKYKAESENIEITKA